ncbi:MAG TPA: mechanosensitive ion channel family protein [Longimicrobiales bacterium]|nr:mechanosensitive ion channel family protein [Longimicrobiales bacterium]
MEEAGFWNTVFLGNTLVRWAIAVGIALGITVALRITVTALTRQVKRFAGSTSGSTDDLIGDLLARTRLLFFLVVGVWGASFALELSPRLLGMLRAALVLAAVLQVALWATTFATWFLTQYRRKAVQEDPSIATAMGAVGFLVRVGVWAVALLVALDTMGVDVTALVAGLGVGGIAVALAVQNVLGDLFASISIILDKPFVVGDFITLQDYAGAVEHVGLKTTRLRSISGEQLVIANSDLLTSRIRNFKRMAERRVVFQIGVVYGTEPDKLRRIPTLIRKAVESRENARFDRSHLMAFGDSALLYETVYFMTVPDYTAYMDTQQAINLELYESFAAEGIEFAYPTQTLFVKAEEAALAKAS